MTTAGGSVVAYERWRETHDQRILDEIEDYNRIYCVSTEELRDWIVSIRPKGSWPSLPSDASDQELQDDAGMQALRHKLEGSDLNQEQQDLLFNLGTFHDRDTKPSKWAVFNSVAKEEDDLLDDLDALAGLVAITPTEPIKRSFQRRYSFPG